MNKQAVNTLFGLLLMIFLSACKDRSQIRTSVPLPTETPRSLPVTVYFSTLPTGANIILNGELIGQTYIGEPLLPGVYHVEFRLDGFIPSSQVVIVEAGHSVQRIFQPLEPEHPSILMQIETGEPRYLEWDMNQARLYFQVPYYGQPENKPPNTLSCLDLKTGEVYTGLPIMLPPSRLTDTQLRETLGIADIDADSIFNTAYLSPSGQYVTYIPPNGDSRLAFYDTQNQLISQTYILLDTSGTSSARAYQPHWSPDETIVWIQTEWFERGCNLVLLKDGVAEEVDCSSFLKFMALDENDFISGGDVLSPPTNEGYILLRVVINGLPTIWLINVKTLSGEPILLENPLDAAFYLDGQTIYIAHAGGISQTTVSDPDKIELTTDLMKTWNLRHAYFSPNAEYVLLEATNGDSFSYWVYKLTRE